MFGCQEVIPLTAATTAVSRPTGAWMDELAFVVYGCASVVLVVRVSLLLLLLLLLLFLRYRARAYSRSK